MPGWARWVAAAIVRSGASAVPAAASSPSGATTSAASAGLGTDGRVYGTNDAAEGGDWTSPCEQPTWVVRVSETTVATSMRQYFIRSPSVGQQPGGLAADYSTE